MYDYIKHKPLYKMDFPFSLSLNQFSSVNNVCNNVSNSFNYVNVYNASIVHKPLRSNYSFPFTSYIVTTHDDTKLP